ncbi:MAG: SDR family oxidoreductase [Phycisphaerae bacterium]|nr:SDR family oxidoreductase [Phycisphaerae bacterium]
MSFLNLENKIIVVFGVANKRSVAYHIARALEQQGAEVIYSVQTTQHRATLNGLLENRQVHVCDVRHDEQIASLVEAIQERHGRVDGLVHSIAFANYESFSGVFHEVSRADFLETIDISCYSLIALANAFKTLFSEQASVVAISISSTRMAADGYGYMAPAKAALDSAVAFLAKSFSRFSQVRFNAVCAGLLKTSASAGIPGYVDNYLYAEQVTLRKKALSTTEVANVAAFLLSECSSGINAQGIVTDCGMGINYFDANVVNATVSSAWPT